MLHYYFDIENKNTEGPSFLLYGNLQMYLKDFVPLFLLDLTLFLFFYFLLLFFLIFLTLHFPLNFLVTIHSLMARGVIESSQVVTESSLNSI